MFSVFFFYLSYRVYKFLQTECKFCIYFCAVLFAHFFLCHVAKIHLNPFYLLFVIDLNTQNRWFPFRYFPNQLVCVCVFSKPSLWSDESKHVSNANNHTSIFSLFRESFTLFFFWWVRVLLLFRNHENWTTLKSALSLAFGYYFDEKTKTSLWACNLAI